MYFQPSLGSKRSETNLSLKYSFFHECYEKMISLLPSLANTVIA